MLFNSLEFALFFPLVLGLYVLLARRGQNLMLLAASYLFYGWWDYRFLSLILISTVVDYICGRQLGTATEPNRRKRWLWLSVGVNLGILGFFKYFDFFAAGMADLLALVGLRANPGTLNILLPVGISFYTFQTMSYTIDVYRGRMEPRRNLLEFALFVSFFPQLVAGPIERARVLLPQIENPRRITFDGLSNGTYLIAWGLFKKIFIADNLARYVAPVFSETGSVEGAAVLLAVYAFAFQIYCDFSGYSDIARGCAKCLGFELMVNFNRPYFATGPRDFWRRWHISLSTWLRDYLYVSLGGNRGESWKTCRNLMLTMVLGGLWHGASWVFVLWGVFHGVMLVAHRLAGPLLDRVRPMTRPGRATWWLVRWFVWFHLTCAGWLIFRAESVAQIFTLLSAVVGGVVLTPAVVTTAMYLLFYLAFLLLVHLLSACRTEWGQPLRWPWPIRSLCYAYMFYAVVVFGQLETRAFIYFQF